MTADDEVLQVLRAVDNLTVHDGFPPADEDEKVIRVELPYVVFLATTPRDNDARFDGRAAGTVEEFQLTGVGETREQAKAILDRARSAINRRRIGRGLCKRDVDNLPVRPDDTYTRPGGAPIFYGVDRYTLPT